MIPFRLQIEGAAENFPRGFTIADIREDLGWADTINVDNRIRYSLNKMQLSKVKRVGTNTNVYMRKCGAALSAEA